MLTHKRMLTSALAASVLLVVSGCATMFTPGIQAVPVASTPQGAEVFIDGDFVGVTPIIVSVTANENHEVIVRFGEDEMAWTLERKIGVSGGLGLAGDVLILVPFALTSIGLFAWSAACNSLGECEPSSGLSLALGIGAAAVAATPIAIDTATRGCYEL